MKYKCVWLRKRQIHIVTVSSGIVLSQNIIVGKP